MTNQGAMQAYRRLLGYLKPYWAVFVIGIIANLAYGDEADGHRVIVVTVKSGDTSSALADRMAVPDHHLERFMILNGLYPGDTLAAGSKVKLIR